MSSLVPAQPDVELAGFLDRLRGERLIFFPVRHHSPACAWHLRELIREARPAGILIEGPETFDRFIPHLLHPDTVPPVAIYTQFVEKSDGRKAGKPGKGGEGGKAGEADEDGNDRKAGKPGKGGEGERRYGSFYPLCDYSPELVALREGAAAGARVAFFDLDYPRQVRSERRADQEEHRLTNLLDEAHLQHSDYLQALAGRRGCRDPDELWDRLFEARFRGVETAAFMRQVAAYCWFARCHTPPLALERDGTLHREAHMWPRIARELRHIKQSGSAQPLLVVTGGFHTPALALGWPRGRLAAAPRAAGRGTSGSPLTLPDPARPDQVLEALIPYGFAQLDALNGYAAGMPSPGFYQKVWAAAGSTARDCFEAAALDFLVELPARLRTAKTTLQLSTADTVAAFSQALLLASARGNPGPSREDLLDGMRSCFVKGELDVEGQLVLQLALELMRGDAVGRLPAGADLHPLVADFRAQAKALRLELGSTAPRQLPLEIYRQPRHQELASGTSTLDVRRSRLFHRLKFLEVPYARFTGGPDFVMGRDLDLQIEHWECAWSPLTESTLIEKTLYGSTIEEACVGLLRERLRRLREDHGEAGALEAVRALTLCLRLDLGDHLGELAAAAHDRLAEESALGPCAEAAAQLQAMLRFPGPFAQPSLPAIERLAAEAYQRSCLLVRDLPRCPESAYGEALEALARLREVVVDEAGQAIADASLLWEAARAALAAPRAPETIRGGLAGLLFAGGEMSPEVLEEHVLSGLQGAGPDGSSAPAYLQGLFALCRELTWQSPGIMRRIDELMARWDEQEFHRSLPYLRLAFADHTPRETDRVAHLLMDLHGGDAAIDWYQRGQDEGLVAANVALAARVAACLERDGLSDFLEPA